MVNKKLDLNSNYKENKAIKIGIWVFTIVVFALVGVMGRLPKPEVAPSFTKALPAVNAIINFTCFLCLVTSFIMIKKKNITMHMRLNTFAMILSVFFLLSYVLYHLTNHETEYGKIVKEIDGQIVKEIVVDKAKMVLYYIILGSHIVLSGLSLPFILFSYYRGFIGNIEAHKKTVKWAYPVWLYVAITGPIVYLMLRPYYS